MSERFKVGQAVCAKHDPSITKLPTSYFTGKVCGHGVVDGELMILVKLDKKYQGYIDLDNCPVAVGFVTMMVVHPDNIEKRQKG